jgi:hypothetical protein
LQFAVAAAPLDGHEAPRRCVAEYRSYERPYGRCGWHAESGRREHDRPDRAADQNSQREADELYNTALFQTIITHRQVRRSSKLQLPCQDAVQSVSFAQRYLAGG